MATNWASSSLCQLHILHSCWVIEKVSLYTFWVQKNCTRNVLITYYQLICPRSLNSIDWTNVLYLLGGKKITNALQNPNRPSSLKERERCLYFMLAFSVLLYFGIVESLGLSSIKYSIGSEVTCIPFLSHLSCLAKLCSHEYQINIYYLFNVITSCRLTTGGHITVKSCFQRWKCHCMT